MIESLFRLAMKTTILITDYTQKYSGGCVVTDPKRQPLGRRERNKQEKLERITAAARDLFVEHGVDEVTTQQIADKADIGTGTLFLYAKTKSELLLMVQNSSYHDALERGRAAAAEITQPLAAVMAIVRPVVECNRTQIDNGRTYLREIVFGDPEEPHHFEALGLTVATENEYAAVLTRGGEIDPARAAVLAHIISAVMFVAMATTINIDKTIDEIVLEIESQVRALLG
ncbi:TetR/AcrR family transcriptional regulator [Actinomycetes bacterium M1A6_2h]